MNSAQLCGRLGRDVETREIGNGDLLAKFSLATNGFSKGEKTTDWHRCVCFGKTAELCSKYLSKGSQVAVEGRIQYSEYEKDGERRFSTEIVVNRVHFLGGGKDEGGSSGKSAGAHSERKWDERDELPF